MGADRGHGGDSWWASRAEPEFIAVFPKNTIVPFIMAVITSIMFMAPTFKWWWLSAIAAVGVTALALVWAWSGGSRQDEGLIDAGRGVTLPTHNEVPYPPGWWGSLFLLLANSVLFGSLLFCYAFLWAVAPNWPPPLILQHGFWGVVLALGGAVFATVGIRLAERMIRGAGPTWIGLLTSLVGLSMLEPPPRRCSARPLITLMLLVIALGSAVGDATFYPDVPLLDPAAATTSTPQYRSGLSATESSVTAGALL